MIKLPRYFTVTSHTVREQGKLPYRLYSIPGFQPMRWPELLELLGNPTGVPPSPGVQQAENAQDNEETPRRQGGAETA